MQIKEILSLSPSNQNLVIKGWVRTKRVSANVAFIALNDGSTIHNIQGVVSDGAVSEETLKLVTTGACIAMKGTLIPSQGQGQSVELQVESIEVYGVADPEKYPLQPKNTLWSSCVKSHTYVHGQILSRPSCEFAMPWHLRFTPISITISFLFTYTDHHRF